MATRSDGFTLIETLLALGILSGVLVAFGAGIVGNWRGIARSESELHALSTARGLIEAAGVETALSTGTRAGITADGLAFRVDIAPYDPTAPNASSALYWVVVAVTPRGATGGAGRPLILRTLKTGGST